MTRRHGVFLRFCTASLCFAGLALAAAATPARVCGEDKPAAGPAHQVIACYFHRTVRCPTCKLMSSKIEESMQAGFAAQLEDKSVQLRMVDFQDAKNQKYTQAYRIAGPTLVLLDVRDGKVTAWKRLPKVWSLLGKEEEFSKYLQGEIRGFLGEQPAAAPASGSLAPSSR